MQEKQNNNTPNEVSSKHSVSIGALLVNARNRAALSQTDVADQINLPLRTITTLEKDDFEHLPESIYIRGYLRSYARVVGIEAEGLVNVYNAQHHVESEISSRSNPNPSYDSAILWSSAAVLTILIGLLVTWWVDVKQTPEQDFELVSNESVSTISKAGDDAATQSSSTADNKVDKIIQPPIEEASKQIPPPEEDQALPSNSGESLTTDVKQAMEEESLNPNLVTLHDGGADVLTVTYVEKSWTEIRDADLNPLMQGLIEPGVVRDLSGKAPFHIFLGNSPGVVIEVNGQYFDHSEYNRSNRTARFQVSSGSFN